MKPAPFEYHRPGSLDEALDLLARHGGDAKPLAGGQSLIPAMNFRLAQPAVLVDLNALDELSYITGGTDGLRIGGMTRQRALERSALVAREAPLMAQAVRFVAHPAIRTRGTLGGSVAHADPAAEMPAVMLALDAALVVRGQAGTRTIPASAFFTGLFSTAIDAGELLTEIVVPVQAARTACAFDEISRRHGDFALAGVAASVSLDDAGRCRSARVALLGVADRPVLATKAAAILEGQAPSAERIRAAAIDSAASDIDPAGDIHASSDYRRHLAGVLLRRVLTRAFDAARQG